MFEIVILSESRVKGETMTLPFRLIHLNAYIKTTLITILGQNFKTFHEILRISIFLFLVLAVETVKVN